MKEMMEKFKTEMAIENSVTKTVVYSLAGLLVGYLMKMQ